jgi:hypothetical protein
MVHDLAPRSDAVPFGHALHEDAGSLSENVPAAQSVHDDAFDGEYDPAGQVAQLLWPVVFAYVPPEQGVQLASPPRENEPSGHWTHVVLFGAGTVPAEQILQSACAVAARRPDAVPGGQGVHVPGPTVLL